LRNAKPVLQEDPGGARRGQEEPGGARRARRSQEDPGLAELKTRWSYKA